MLKGMWKKLTVLMLCISLSCAGVVTCLAESTTEESADEASSLLEEAKAFLENEDYDAAIPILEEAARQGSAEAQNELGKCYTFGTGVEQSDEEAFKYFQMAADQGYAKSLNNVANYYATGNVVDQDDAKAFEFYKLAADQGLPNAQCALGFYYENGIGVEQDLEEAVKYFQLAAEQGFADAQNNLALCYLNGTGIPQDVKEAIKLFQLAADQGNAAAQNTLGYCYSEGLGVEQDDEKAVQYYQLSADQGDPDGIYNLGYGFYYGEGVEQDYEKALDLFHQAAEMGQANAIFLIGECYYEGKAVEKDLEEAAVWYQKALDAGYVPDEEDQKHLAEVPGEDYAAVEETDASGSRVGGWEIIPHEVEELPEDAQAAFDKAVEGLVGAKYTPVALMATQLVAGTNYCILCQVSPVVPNPELKWALVYIYADLQGNAEIMNVYELYIDRHSGLEEKEEGSSDDILDEMSTAIRSFEEEHPELKEQFHLMVSDLTDIATTEYREAFINIQNRFGEMLEDNRKQVDVTDEEDEIMREKLQMQAALLNANFIAAFKTSEERMIAMLRGEDYQEGETDTITILKNISEEMQGNDDEEVSKLKSGIDQILETAEKEYGNDLEAWYKEVSARPELPADAAGSPDDGTRPPKPEEGEMPEGNPPEEEGAEAGIPFKDHFMVIQEELKGASERIDKQIQELAGEAPEKYQISEETADEAFSLLNQLFIVVNGQMMEQLGRMDAITFESMMDE